MILYTGVDKLPLGQVTILRSRAFPPLLRTHCVSFWYYLSGSDPGECGVCVCVGHLKAMAPFALPAVWGASAA